ncbi:MAG: gliding motility-associated C-terminal domain-containing protein [Bacteroidia bacterium]|nr:gliding motility-associated C-terminal domain-containing protein [Bacteroidia bacterium]
MKTISLLLIILLSKGYMLYCQQPFQFIENKNQWDKNVLFRSDIPGGTVFFRKTGPVFDFIDPAAIDKMHCHCNSKPENIRHHAIFVTFLNSSDIVNVRGTDIYPNYNNYFLGNNPEKWASKVRIFKNINYSGIYPGIDLNYYNSGKNLKYDIILHPGANIQILEIKLDGADRLKLKNDELVITTSVNEFEELKPVAYQTIDGKRRDIPCRFELEGNILKFRLSGNYDNTKDIIIDPVLVFSTYSGSYADNFGFTATFDLKGFLYSGGLAFGSGYPTTPGAYQVSFTGVQTDMGITKYDTTGHFPVYSTYIGGTKADVPASLVVNDNDELFILGVTGSSDFPVTGNAYDTTFKGGSSVVFSNGYGISFPSGTDIVISKLSNDGSALLASTYLGGSQNDGLNTSQFLKYNYGDVFRGDIFVDHSDNCYIASTTCSTNFPVTPGAFQPIYGGSSQDAVVAKLDGNLHNLIWGSFLGGIGDDAGYSLAVTVDSKVYVAGGTSSINFHTTPNALNPTYLGGQSDAFLSCISSDGHTLLNSTLFGSGDYDQAFFVQLDKQNNPYIYGQTKASGSSMVYNAGFSQPNSGQFISKLSPDLHSLIFSTVFGSGSGHIDISPTAFLVDACNHIYISGWGGHVNDTIYGGHGGNTSNLTVTPDAFQSTTDGSDFYLMVLEENADSMLYATFFGGPVSYEHVDGGTSRFSKNGTVYQSVCAGCGYHNDFPTTPGAWSSVNNAQCNNAVFKFDFQIPLTVAGFESPPLGCFPAQIEFQNNSHDGVNYSWLVNNIPVSTSQNLTYNFTSAGTYQITLIASNPSTCNVSDTLIRVIQIYANNNPQNLNDLNTCNDDSVQIGIPPSADPSVTYHWFPPQVVSDPASSATNALPPGDQVMMLVSTQYSCSDTFYQAIHHYFLNVTNSPGISICTGDSTQIFVSSNGTNCHYTWSTSPDMSNPFNTTDSMVTVHPADTTAYYCLVSTDYCNELININVNTSQVDLLAEPGFTICFGDSVQLNAVTNNPNENLVFNWQPASHILSGEHSQHPVISISEPTIFNVTATNAWGCSDTSSILVSISDFSLSNYNIIVPDYDTIYQYQSAQVHVTAPISGLTYHWLPLTGNPDPSSQNPVLSPLQTTTYYVTVSDSYGCERFDSITIVVKDVLCNDLYVFVPNAFTPNGDKVNDVLYVQSVVVKDLYFAVYDRWGEKVFETTDVAKGWNGTFRGQALDPAVFVYYLKATCLNGRVFEKHGNITLIR